MIEATADEHYAAARFAVLTGGRFVRSKTDGYGGIASGELLEYVLPSGEVLARKVVACGAVECWLRPDVLEQTQAALAAEAAEHERVRADIVAWADRKDAPLAAARGLTVEKFREQRNYAGMRFDRYRAAQRSGG